MSLDTNKEASTTGRANELATSGVGYVAQFLGAATAAAAWIGVTGAAPLASVATVVAATSRIMDERLAAKEKRNATRLINGLARRLASVEAREPSEQENDLFAHLWKRAVEEEDERKILVHECFIAWACRTKRDSATTRLLGEAIANLTYEELLGFVDWAKYHRRAPSSAR